MPELAHGLRGSDDVFSMRSGQLSAPFPIDCALAPISDAVWDRAHEAAAVPEHLLDWAHVAVPREILFFRGYAQENSSFHFETLLSGSTSYGTQEMESLPASLDSRFFFALHHSPEKAEIIDGDGHLPLPSGFSGSTVWNTRYVECLQQNEPWTRQKRA